MWFSAMESRCLAKWSASSTRRFACCRLRRPSRESRLTSSRRGMSSASPMSAGTLVASDSCRARRKDRRARSNSPILNAQKPTPTRTLAEHLGLSRSALRYSSFATGYFPLCRSTAALPRIAGMQTSGWFWNRLNTTSAFSYILLRCGSSMLFPVYRMSVARFTKVNSEWGLIFNAVSTIWMASWSCAAFSSWFALRCASSMRCEAVAFQIRILPSSNGIFGSSAMCFAMSASLLRTISRIWR
mmetsp:Transcript_28924/g.92438  ORF Transcript_28924/g.92438 Transcript_28924/m.92438 type:complete len:243 (+) Transcript_28924:2973-3701(+)